MFLSISDAAKKAGIARSTLYKMRDSGKISLSKDSDGVLGIELSELCRVFPDSLKTKAEPKETAGDRNSKALEIENMYLKEKVKRLEDDLTEEKMRSQERVDTLLSVTREQSKQLLLTHETSTAKEKKSFWLRWKDSA
jgi:hypothetical protein